MVLERVKDILIDQSDHRLTRNVLIANVALLLEKYVADAGCFVFTCRRLIDLLNDCIAGTMSTAQSYRRATPRRAFNGWNQGGYALVRSEIMISRRTIMNFD